MLSLQADRAREAGRLFAEYFQAAAELGENLNRLGDIEAASVVSNAELASRLTKSLVTPIDPEDMQILSASMARLVQSVRRAASAGAGMRFRTELAKPAELIAAIVDRLAMAAEQPAHWETALAHANAAVQLHREARARLREATYGGLAHQQDPVGWIEYLKATHCLAEVLDCSLRTSRRLQSLVLKNV